MRDRSQGLLDLKGLVMDVSGPQRNACPGTLTPQEGLVSLHLRRAQKDAFEFVLWVGIAGREELVTKLSSRGVNGTHLLLLASSGCGWLTASPHIKRGFVDSTFYSHTSMLKTMELIPGLKPMSIFDLIANDMRNSFQGKPELTPYTALKPEYSLPAVNPPLHVLTGQKRLDAEASLRMNFKIPEAVPTEKLNRILWRDARGTKTPYPKVSQALFTLPSYETDDGKEESNGETSK